MKIFNEVEIDEYEDDEFLSVFFKEFWGALLGMIRGQDYYKGQVGDCSKVKQFWEKMSIYECLS